MGTQYWVGCRDCKVYRHVDKIKLLDNKIETRDEALEFAKDVEENSFRAGLIVSFMAEHKGHNCTLFWEHDDKTWEEFEDEYKAVLQDDQFWHAYSKTEALEKKNP